MRVERTEDVEFISSVLRHPDIADLVSDDGEVKLPIHPELYYLVPKIEIGVEPGIIEERAIGCLAFAPVNYVTWNPHAAILPQYRGRGTEAMRLGIQWMRENTRCRKLVANVPEYNARMIRVFQKCKFQHEGFSPGSALKRDVLYGRVLMGRGIDDADA